MADLFTYAQSQQARDEGMTRAVEHADRVEPSWSREAYAFLVSFARTHLHFISEDVSGASKGSYLPQPPTDRAWGSIYRRAIKAGIIVQDGMGRSKRRHASICPRWRSRIYQGT